MQFNNIQLNLLLKNPKLDTYTQQLFENDNYIANILNYQLKIEEIKDQPFIFSCFALSTDGKLYYPDLPSGFSIAKCNAHASVNEKNADLLTLMLARTISDLVIVGTRSLNNELGSYIPEITIPELNVLRSSNNKSVVPTTLVVCHNLDNIDFSHTIFNSDEFQVIICCINNNIDVEKLPTSYKHINMNNWVSKQELANKNIIMINHFSDLITKLYQVGFKIILNESPYSHHQLLELQLLNEIWLNYSGSYIGGSDGLGKLQEPFTSANHPDCELLTLHSLGYNFLYTRQKILYSKK